MRQANNSGISSRDFCYHAMRIGKVLTFITAVTAATTAGFFSDEDSRATLVWLLATGFLGSVMYSVDKNFATAGEIINESNTVLERANDAADLIGNNAELERFIKLPEVTAIAPMQLSFSSITRPTNQYGNCFFAIITTTATVLGNVGIFDKHLHNNILLASGAFIFIAAHISSAHFLRKQMNNLVKINTDFVQKTLALGFIYKGNYRRASVLLQETQSHHLQRVDEIEHALKSLRLAQHSSLNNMRAAYQRAENRNLKLEQLLQKDQAALKQLRQYLTDLEASYGFILDRSKTLDEQLNLQISDNLQLRTLLDDRDEYARYLRAKLQRSHHRNQRLRNRLHDNEETVRSAGGVTLWFYNLLTQALEDDQVIEFVPSHHV